MTASDDGGGEGGTPEGRSLYRGPDGGSSPSSKDAKDKEDSAPAQATVGLWKISSESPPPKAAAEPPAREPQPQPQSPEARAPEPSSTVEEAANPPAGESARRAPRDVPSPAPQPAEESSPTTVWQRLSKPDGDRGQDSEQGNPGQTSGGSVWKPVAKKQSGDDETARGWAPEGSGSSTASPRTSYRSPSNAPSGTGGGGRGTSLYQRSGTGSSPPPGATSERPYRRREERSPSAPQRGGRPPRDRAASRPPRQEAEKGPWGGRRSEDRPPERSRFESRRPEGQRPERHRSEGRSFPPRPAADRWDRPAPDPKEREAAQRRAQVREKLAAVEDFEVKVDQLVAGGEGLARLDGIPIFIPRAAPGDRLRVRISQRHASYGRAEILEILEPGPGRREAPCRFFSQCGGCDLQHLEDAEQVRLKVGAMLETLRRLGGVNDPPSVRVRAETPWGYRLRTQLQVQAEDTEPGRPPLARVGYHVRGTHELVAVDACPVLAPELEGLLPQLPEILGQPLADHGSPHRLDLAVGDDGAIGTAPVVEGLPHGELTITVAGEIYSFDARCFFQGHRTLLPALVEEVLGPEPAKDDATREETVFDLYSGVGLFSLPLARRHQRVVAVEGDRLAARYARKNARRAQLRHVDVANAAVESWVSAHLPAGAARVVVDPPRDGISRGVRKVILERRPRQLTYVSCHAAALARDLRELRAAGYRLESLTALDLFPQTGHLETVAQLFLEA